MVLRVLRAPADPLNSIYIISQSNFLDNKKAPANRGKERDKKHRATKARMPEAAVTPPEA